MSQVNHDPLYRIKGLKKLECFNKKKFKELKYIFKEIVGVYSLKGKKRLKRKEDKKDKREERFLKDNGMERDILFIEYKDRGDEWMDRDKWDMVISPDNYWGDLNIEEEERLSRLLKGRDNIIL